MKIEKGLSVEAMRKDLGLDELRCGGYVEFRIGEDMKTDIERAHDIEKKTGAHIWVCDFYWESATNEPELSKLIDETDKLFAKKKPPIRYSTMQEAIKESAPNDIIVCGEGMTFFEFGRKDFPETKDFVTMSKKYGWKNLTYIFRISSLNQVFQRRQFTNEDVAKMLDVSPTYVSKARKEMEERTPSPLTTQY